MSIYLGNIKKVTFIIWMIISSWAFSAIRSDSVSVYKIKDFRDSGKISISESTNIDKADSFIYVSEDRTAFPAATLFVSEGTTITENVFGKITYEKPMILLVPFLLL